MLLRLVHMQSCVTALHSCARARVCVCVCVCGWAGAGDRAQCSSLLAELSDMVESVDCRAALSAALAAAARRLDDELKRFFTPGCDGDVH
jgi:hypothetical protein